ncbi:MAG: FHA domain-containing protein, partial [Deltaproteobacteria bacterium]|nr:FHA domain-containing protein [Deltaproteobacteria bacterium]
IKMALLLLTNLRREKNNQSVNLVMKDAFLFLSQGPGPSTGYPLLGEDTIGSDPDNTICLADETVSPNHARVTFQEGAWTVEDLGSTSGIIFKGKRVNKIVLSSEDTFEIGSFTFRFTEADIPEARDQFFETVTIL